MQLVEAVGAVGHVCNQSAVKIAIAQLRNFGQQGNAQTGFEAASQPAHQGTERPFQKPQHPSKKEHPHRKEQRLCTEAGRFGEPHQAAEEGGLQGHAAGCQERSGQHQAWHQPPIGAQRLQNSTQRLCGRRQYRLQASLVRAILARCIGRGLDLVFAALGNGKASSHGHDDGAGDGQQF